MFATIADFESTWKMEMGFTQSVMDALTDGSLSQAVSEEHRTLGRMAWHIVTTIPEMATQVGIIIDGPEPSASMPDTADEIKDAYRTVSKSLLDGIKAAWNDDTLQQEHNIIGETWKRGKALHVVVLHEIHHRGQMTVLMRQAGIKVPSLYGPAKESWAEYGTPPPEI